MKIGKRTKINIEANRKLKAIYIGKGIPEQCELKLPGCMLNWGLGFCHKHKRIYYYGKEELLSSFNETILACTNCHQQIEGNRKLTEEVFKKLRGC